MLGDLEDVEQLRDLEARVTVDEMQHAMMGSAETVAIKDAIRAADEIAIAEKEQLDDLVGGLRNRVLIRRI
ncbi:hypothetical protein GCM10007276_16980 [Agaricicola taiwanensis]|uniref:Uncharacterized protein n=1 Tax=Agaricicola taiwanensis TaxID=591372 RepID=A0A8J2VUJ3_9RHOB|nr:hypothetical protein GCM10007276_16980 [Agaricicola taiwanensis]